jgi:hypothetical protein
MSDSAVASRVREFSGLILLICFWGWVCRAYGYMPIPLWLILTPVTLVVLFWGAAFLLAFIAWVICMARKVDREIEEEKRKSGTDEQWW